jgi:hypothetical protein
MDVYLGWNLGELRMSVNYQFRDVDAYGAVIRAKANSRGQKVQTAGSNMAGTHSAVGSSWA